MHSKHLYDLMLEQCTVTTIQMGYLSHALYCTGHDSSQGDGYNGTPEFFAGRAAGFDAAPRTVRHTLHTELYGGHYTGHYTGSVHYKLGARLTSWERALRVRA
jgi:hypothetical protein